MKQTLASALLLTLIATIPAATAADAAKPKRPVDGIMDNSFLVEEAYNQEPGVVQHIVNAIYGWNKQGGGPHDRSWNFAFTQEWPLWSQTHQFSYTIPYSSVRTGGQADNGLGDIQLNYRLQAYFNEDTLTAFAPRVSLVLPTGRTIEGFSDDTVGAQFNLPYSTTLGDRWFAHANAGLTWLPRSAAQDPRRDLVHLNWGASAIYAASSDVHLMLEWAANWNETTTATGARDRQLATVISPGIRKAFDCPGDSQLVLGIAAPIGITAAAPDFGVFLYISFEHAFKKRK